MSTMSNLIVTKHIFIYLLVYSDFNFNYLIYSCSLSCYKSHKGKNVLFWSFYNRQVEKYSKIIKEKCKKPEETQSQAKREDETQVLNIPTQTSNPLKLVDYEDDVKSAISEEINTDGDLISLEKLQTLGSKI